MNINVGGVLGVFAGIGFALLISLPIDMADTESAGRVGKIAGIGLVAGAFAGNIAWSYLFDKSKRR